MRRRLALAMMNVVAIGLVLSTLAAAGVWSPAPTPPTAGQHGGEHVVREGRRVVIVEYEREHPLYPGDSVKETHVLPADALDGGEGMGGLTDKAKGVASDAADKAAEAAEGGKEALSDAKESATGKVFGAVKRCKDRICGAARKAEDGAKEKASSVDSAWCRANCSRCTSAPWPTASASPSRRTCSAASGAPSPRAPRA
uniref:Uncharacterized protein n=1 Tax=Oryza brachyantha TaxID=4533 RepID=J3LY13_ORYBR